MALFLRTFFARQRNFTRIIQPTCIYMHKIEKIRPMSGCSSSPSSTNKNDFSEKKVLPVLKLVLKNLWPKNNTELKARILGSVGLLIASKTANVAVPYTMKLIIDSLTNSASISSIDTGTLLTLPAMFVVAYGTARILSSGSHELKNAIFAKVAQKSIRQTALTTFDHLMNLDMNFHANRRIGVISKIMDRGTRSMSFILSTLIFNWIPTIFEIGLVVGIMSVYCGAPFVLTSLSCISVYVLYTLLVTNWRIKFRVDMNNAENLANSRIVDALINYETVKLFNNEQHERQHLDRTFENYEKASLKTSTSLAVLNFGQSAIFTSSLVIMMLMACDAIIKGDMTVGDMAMINGLLFQLSVPLNFLGSLYRDVREAIINLNNIYSLLQIKSSIKNEHSPEQDKNLTKMLLVNEHTQKSNYIEFDKVNFTYSSENFDYIMNPGSEKKPPKKAQTNSQTLTDVSFTVPYNKKVAIVGGSGSGKSTLIKLLYRFYDVDSGRISINNTNINQLSLHALRNHITVVPQDINLFHDSIEYNISYGRPGASRQEIEQAALQAGLGDVLKRAVKGLDTPVGERGLMLSGGEKQRVAIARAILKNSPILVYDEATSSLDSLLEKRILTTLQSVFKDKTTIVIAHRLSTIVDADDIVVMHQGRVIERGDHRALLANMNSVYSELWKKQNDTVYKNKKSDSRDEIEEKLRMESDINCKNTSSDKCCSN